ncbi:MAG TPA: SRPBCC family protein [Mycobacterium sp.]
MTDQRFVVTRTIPAAPAEIFALLSDPTRHQETEPGDWVRDAVDSRPIYGTGQMFAMNMYFDRAGGDGDYVVHNVVSEFEQDRIIAWLPGELDDSGEHNPGGWFWRYDLSPTDGGTDVTLTYDWTNTPQEFRDQVEMPPFPVDFIEQSLASLERAVR